jgi:hypothetical protein
MSMEFESVFVRLREILKTHAGSLSVNVDSADYFSLHASTGPATLKAWGGKLKSPTIPVAWVQIEKAYVSYHLMGMYGNAKLLDAMSNELKARMQGKACFNFKNNDDALFKELEQTRESIAGFRKAGYIS